MLEWVMSGSMMAHRLIYNGHEERSETLCGRTNIDEWTVFLVQDRYSLYHPTRHGPLRKVCMTCDLKTWPPGKEVSDEHPRR